MYFIFHVSSSTEEPDRGDQNPTVEDQQSDSNDHSKLPSPNLVLVPFKVMHVN